MIKLSPLFIDILTELGLYEEFQLNILRRDLKKLIKPPLSFHIYPAYLKNGRLIVSVDSNEWLYEINLHKQDFLKRFRKYGVRDIKFRLGKIPKQSSGEKKTAPSVEIEIPSELLDRVSENIKDTALRDALIKAIKASIARTEPYADSRSFS